MKKCTITVTSTAHYGIMKSVLINVY